MRKVERGKERVRREREKKVERGAEVEEKREMRLWRDKKRKRSKGKREGGNERVTEKVGLKDNDFKNKK